MADNTPESEIGSIECFQNYTASEVFIQGLAGIVDQQDVESMIRAQKQMLQRFEKTNEMLTNCNNLCVTRLKTASADFKKHTTLLVEMRKDLDNIFKRIQVLKSKTSAQYPEAFAAMPKPEEKESDLVENSSSNNNSVLEPPASSGPVNIMKRGNSWSSESCNNSQQDSSPYTSDTG
ncbi:unnamed protein product [Nezara viridula]|uniref:KxDL domain-containing protein n=1 Tax=Nezara viridula TaxID=85310 RepID=A0A9P0MPP4_NEZVI|nr:unnamed protein product [Nezara viridula]